MAGNGTVEARSKREDFDANCERTTRNAGEDGPIPTISVLEHDVEVRRLTRRYRVIQAVLIIATAVSFAACVASGFRFIH